MSKVKHGHHLFQLIKELSKSEKRYIKLNLTQHQKEDNNMLTLFDAIERQEVYNEKK